MNNSDWMTVSALTLDFDDAWSIGGISVLSDDIDLNVVTDPRKSKNNVPCLPGPSIAGSLRAAATELEGIDVDKLFGKVSKDKNGKPQSDPSAIEILGATLVGDSPKEEKRRRTAINLETGAAKKGSLRNEQFVGATTFRIVVQIRGVPGDKGGAVDAWLKLVDNWKPILGRGRTVGLGYARVVRVETISVNLKTANGLGWWLRQKTDFFANSYQSPRQIEGELLSDFKSFNKDDSRTTGELKVDFELVEPLHLGFENPEEGEIKVYRQFDNLCIPGTSWKGVFRHQAEVILNVLTSDKSMEEDKNQVISLLFGSADTGRGLLSFRNSKVVAADGRSNGTTGKREHVAIDRFAGGAKDSAKFTWECALPGNHVTLTIDAAKLDEHLPNCKNLLKHIVRDFHDGLIGIGGGISRGYGQVSVTGHNDNWANGLESEQPKDAKQSQYPKALTPEGINIDELFFEVASFLDGQGSLEEAAKESES